MTANQTEESADEHFSELLKLMSVNTDYVEGLQSLTEHHIEQTQLSIASLKSLDESTTELRGNARV